MKKNRMNNEKREAAKTQPPHVVEGRESNPLALAIAFVSHQHVDHPMRTNHNQNTVSHTESLLNLYKADNCKKCLH